MIKMKLKGKDALFRQLRAQLTNIVATSSERQVSRMQEELVNETPIDTGEARSGWKTVKTATGFNVVNDVPHVAQLNEGSSKQAPAHFVEQVALKYGTPVGVIVEVQK